MNLKLLFTISLVGHEESLQQIYDEYNIPLRNVIQAKGTASSSLLNYFGLAETVKNINISVIPDYLEKDLLNKINETLNIENPGTGIVFTISLTSANKFLLNGFEQNKVKEKTVMNEKKYHLILTIVLEGHLEQVMSAAKRVGAQGGTVIKGRGLGNKEAEKLFGFKIEPGREIVLNVVEESIKNKVMEEITKVVGIKTPGRGIILSLPVDNAIGIDNEKY